MAKKFPMGAWVYNPITDFTPDEVDVWADMGLTVTMCGTVDYDNAELLLPFLDRAQARDIRLIVWVYGIGDARRDEDDYKARFKALYENKLRKHPALYGFFIGDEPSSHDAAEYMIAEMKAQKDVAPELHPYINLMGSTCGNGSIYPGKTYPEFLADIKERTACESFCFDVYDQTINDGGVTNFYATMKDQNEAANIAGIDCWATLLQVRIGHTEYQRNISLLGQFLTRLHLAARALCGSDYTTERSRRNITAHPSMNLALRQSSITDLCVAKRSSRSILVR